MDVLRSRFWFVVFGTVALAALLWFAQPLPAPEGTAPMAQHGSGRRKRGDAKHRKRDSLDRRPDGMTHAQADHYASRGLRKLIRAENDRLWRLRRDERRAQETKERLRNKLATRDWAREQRQALHQQEAEQISYAEELSRRELEAHSAGAEPASASVASGADSAAGLNAWLEAHSPREAAARSAARRPHSRTKNSSCRRSILTLRHTTGTRR